MERLLDVVAEAMLLPQYIRWRLSMAVTSPFRRRFGGARRGQDGTVASAEAAVPDAFRRSVKVVAGARNHLNLLFDAPSLG
jgi:hypothetical protein